MKLLSFSATEILPALLAKQKRQTIRPAWKEECYLTYCKLPKVSWKGEKVNRKCVQAGHVKEVVEKPARFKVGENIRLAWRSRGTPKNALFCSGCGKEANQSERNGICNLIKPCGCVGAPNTIFLFTKILGTATINYVGKISLAKGHLVADNKLGNSDEIAKKDGFKNIEEMIDWFDKKYDLSESKQFWCYTWRWDK